MLRRRLLVSLPVLAFARLWPGQALAQGFGALQHAFDRLSPDDRRAVQRELQTGGFYEGAIDGRFGPATGTALVQAAEFLAYGSRGKVEIDLQTPDGIADYLQRLASGALSSYLYGEGEDCTAC